MAVIRDCIDCEKYERQIITILDPAIECSTLGIGIQPDTVAASVGECQVFNMNLNIVLAMCCVPIGDNQGNPPPADELTNITLCQLEDEEAIKCCVQSIKFGIQGVHSDCKPKLGATNYSREGNCWVTRIAMAIPNVPCCV